MVKTVSYGLLSSNTYIVYKKRGGECMIIDCGAELGLVLPFIEENELTVKYIVLTHGHFDHADFIDEYKSKFKDALLVCHTDEKVVLEDPEANLSFWGNRARSYLRDFTYVNDADELILGKDSEECMKFEVIHTPGHTPGSICLLCKRDGFIITGDTIFKSSYGRTDFKHGDRCALISSLERVLSLDEGTVIYPGHYGSTTVLAERSFYA